VPAKKDPNPGKLELRLLFFSSLILPPSEKPLNRVSITLPACIINANHGLRRLALRQLRFEYLLKAGRIAAVN
jgi:hypothetical protein